MWYAVDRWHVVTVREVLIACNMELGSMRDNLRPEKEKISWSFILEEILITSLKTDMQLLVKNGIIIWMHISLGNGSGNGKHIYTL